MSWLFAPVKFAKPHTFGWLRRPELDRLSYEAWERPDGKLYLHWAKTPLLLPVVKKPPEDEQV